MTTTRHGSGSGSLQGRLRGFTLVELVAAVALFGILMVALVRLTVVLHGTARIAGSAVSDDASPVAWERRVTAMLAADFAGATTVEIPPPEGPLELVHPAATLPPVALLEHRTSGNPPAIPPAEPSQVAWHFLAPLAGASDATGRLVRDVVPLLDRDASPPLRETVVWGVKAVQWETEDASLSDSSLTEIHGIRLRLELVDAREVRTNQSKEGRKTRLLVIDVGEPLAAPRDLNGELP